MPPFRRDMKNNRLALIAQMVRPCPLAADIGADHGRLICQLVTNGTVQRGIAADINPMPLAKAQSLIAKLGLEDRIETACTDGLSGIPPAQAVIIAGMGGELIARIIENWEHSRSGSTIFYLQPMTKAERLRGYLYTNGYSIVTENCCVDRGKPYSVMKVKYTGRPITPTPEQLWLGEIDPTAGEWERQYCERLLARLGRIAQGRERRAGCNSRQWTDLVEKIGRIAKGETE